MARDFAPVEQRNDRAEAETLEVRRLAMRGEAIGVAVLFQNHEVVGIGR